ncbi:class I SAM-dependent methyltransferase [soil metagenome]
MGNRHEGSSPLRESMTRRLYRRSAVEGTIRLPAVPGMIDDYVTMCGSVFADIGRVFSAEELDHLKSVVQQQLDAAYEQSPRATIVIAYQAPSASLLNYEVNIEWLTLEDAYERWLSTREPPLFGSEPDARVWELAAGAADPANYPILDIGAGTGRNTLALARRGHPVDAVELTPKFAEVITADAAEEMLPVHVLQGDVFTSPLELRRDYQLIVLSEVVSDFRSTQQLRKMFALAADCLAPGGQLVFNAFVAKAGFVPDDATLQLGQQYYTTIFTEDEIASAASGLALIPVGDDSVYDYEKAHLPAEDWPPTSWYEQWVSGQDIFDVPREESPIELRWRVYLNPVSY